MKEIWKDIIGYEGLYQISNLGRVKNIVRNTLLSKRQNEKNYWTINLCVNRKVKSLKVHRLLYQHFIGPLIKGMFIDHIDNNQSNNDLSNLDQISPRKNSSKDKKPKSGYTGVSITKYNKYQSKIRVNDKRIYLGTFDTPEEASYAYQKALLNICQK